MKIKLPPIPQTPPLAREEMQGQASAKQIGNHHSSSVFDLAIPWALDRDEHLHHDLSTTQGFGIDESISMDPPVPCQPPQSCLEDSDLGDSRGQAFNKTEFDQDPQTPLKTVNIESKAQDGGNHRPQQNGDVQGKVSCLSAGKPQPTVLGSSKDEGESGILTVLCQVESEEL